MNSHSTASSDKAPTYSPVEALGNRLKDLEEVTSYLQELAYRLVGPQGNSEALKSGKDAAPAQSDVASTIQSHADWLGSLSASLREITSRINGRL